MKNNFLAQVLVLISFSFISLILTMNYAQAAVTIQQNVTFQTGSTVLYIAGVNFTVDQVTVTSTLLNITNSSTGDFVMSATPSSNSINITILEFTTALKKFNVTSSNSSVTVGFVVGNVTPNVTMKVTENSVHILNVSTNSTGYISFTYTGGGLSTTPNTFEISLYTLPASTTPASSGGGGGGGGGTGVISEQNSITKIFSIINGGSTEKITEDNLNAIDTPIIEISFKVSNKASSVRITISRIDSQPSGIPAPPGLLYKYAQINATNLENKIESAKIKFKVDKGWISRNGVDKSSIALYRYKGQWEKLSTQQLSQDISNLIYESDSPGFSYFAIVAESFAEPPQETVEEPAAEQPQEETPTQTEKPLELSEFQLMIIIIGVVVVAIVAIIVLFIYKSRKEDVNKNITGGI